MPNRVSWHPIFLTEEPTPGVWTMKHPTEDAPFGKIELRRVDGGLRYKVQLYGKVIGWATELSTATERLWEAYTRDVGTRHQGPPNGGR